MVDALSVERLRVRVRGRCLLDDVSFRAAYGEVTCIVGPNGAGKSTLVKALLGLMACEGDVQVNGIALSALTIDERARAIAYVPQRSSLANGVSVVDVVAQARYARRSRFGRVDPHDPSVAGALEQVELGALAQRAFDTLSGGEQRRVLLARALATGARILVFDEPAAGLDVSHVLRFYGLVTRLAAEGYALVLVLHELGDALRSADRALLLDGGRAVAFGAAAEVLSAANIARVYGVHAHEGVALGFSLDGRWR